MNALRKNKKVLREKEYKETSLIMLHVQFCFSIFFIQQSYDNSSLVGKLMKT